MSAPPQAVHDPGERYDGLQAMLYPGGVVMTVMLEDRVVKLLRAHAFPGRAIVRSAKLDADLCLDSLDRAELLLEVEQSFGVRFYDAAAGEWATVGDLVDAVRRALDEQTTNVLPSRP
jgi:acyl carrier protein